MRVNFYGYFKRVLDVVGASLLLIVLCPLLLIVALLIRIMDGSPVLFSQTRIGKNEKPFTLYKFRTMTSEGASGLSVDERVATDGARVSALGQFLRSTSIDELPELFNIMRSDMSFVGPRPLLPEYLPLYNETQARRHEVRPGLTGLAQVNGRNALSWPERFAYDVTYVDSYSLPLDARIMLSTFGLVLKREGATGAAAASMEPFRGEQE